MKWAEYYFRSTQKSLSELLAVVDDDDAFDSWLEHQHHLADMYANAEY